MAPDGPRRPADRQIAGYFLSGHAAKRMAQRKATLAEVTECIENPLVTRGSADDPNVRQHWRQRIGAVLDVKHHVIITIKTKESEEAKEGIFIYKPSGRTSFGPDFTLEHYRRLQGAFWKSKRKKR